MLLSRAIGAKGPVSALCVAETLAITAQRLPERLALVALHQDLRLTWSQLQQSVEALANGLWSIGLRPKDRVGICAWNCAEWICLQFAAARIGVVLVNVNPGLGELDLAFIVRHARLRILFIQPPDERANYEELLSRSGASKALERIVVLGSSEWQECASKGSVSAGFRPAADDVVNVQYTSGSTGHPKGVLLTHRNVVNNALKLAAELGIRQDDVLCGQVPMHHCFGYVVSSLLCASTGMTLVFPAARFSPQASLEAIFRERCSVIHGVPTMFSACLQHTERSRFDLSSLRTGIMAGAPCPVALVRRVMNELPCPEITVAYGQTETSPASTISPITAAEDLRQETVGRVMTNTELRLVDAAGATVPRGEVGEIVVRGDCVMQGYDGDEQSTARTVDSGGWLHTGDLAMMREDGYLSIKGRLSDMIIRGGENVYPKEVEDVICLHAGVAECCVFGLPDEHFGEAVFAWVRLRSGSQVDSKEIASFCSGKIARFKTPRQVRFVEQFPLTANGKIDRKRIRELEIAERGLQNLAELRTA